MQTTCILAMKKGSLLNQALSSLLLKSECELKVIPTGADDVTGLIAETANLKPDVVILGESKPLAAQDTLGDLLMSFPELQVVVVSEETNWLHVFRKRDMLMTDQTDLLNVLCMD